VSRQFLPRVDNRFIVFAQIGKRFSTVKNVSFPVIRTVRLRAFSKTQRYAVLSWWRSTAGPWHGRKPTRFRTVQSGHDFEPPDDYALTQFRRSERVLEYRSGSDAGGGHPPVADQSGGAHDTRAHGVAPFRPGLFDRQNSSPLLRQLGTSLRRTVAPFKKRVLIYIHTRKRRHFRNFLSTEPFGFSVYTNMVYANDDVLLYTPKRFPSVLFSRHKNPFATTRHRGLFAYILFRSCRKKKKRRSSLFSPFKDGFKSLLTIPPLPGPVPYDSTKTSRYRHKGRCGKALS